MIKVTYTGRGTIDFNLHNGLAVRLKTGECTKVDGDLKKPKIREYYKQLAPLNIAVANLVPAAPKEVTPQTPQTPAKEETSEGQNSPAKEETSEGQKTPANEVNKDSLMKLTAAQLREKAAEMGITLEGNESKSLIADKILSKLNGEG